MKNLFIESTKTSHLFLLGNCVVTLVARCPVVLFFNCCSVCFKYSVYFPPEGNLPTVAFTLSSIPIFYILLLTVPSLFT
jgi:hypothetical protein